MGRLAWVLAVCCLGLPQLAAAQDVRRTIFAAPGWQTDVTQSSKTYEAGLGIEQLFSRHIGVDAEASGLMFTDREQAREGAGAVSIGLVGHAGSDSRVEVFGEAGYTLLFRNFTTNMFKFGGGMHYWFHDDRAFTIEFVGRQARTSDPLPHYFEIRIGVAFR